MRPPGKPDASTRSGSEAGEVAGSVCSIEQPHWRSAAVRSSMGRCFMRPSPVSVVAAPGAWMSVAHVVRNRAAVPALQGKGGVP